MKRNALLVALTLMGCPTPSDVDGGPVDAGGTDGGSMDPICARQSTETTSDGKPVVVCEELFASAPWLHLPADSDTAVYGGVKRVPAGPAFVGRATSYVVPVAAPAWFDRETAYGNLRYAYFVYRAQVATGVVTEVTPVVRIDDRVFQRLLAGKVLEGLASARVLDAGADPRWAFDQRDLGIRLRLADAPETTSIDQLTGFPRYALLGHVENAHGGVRASDGGCLAALDSYGERNPLFSADGGVKVMILRHPGMHAALDDVFTLDWPEGTTTSNNMGPGLFISVVDLLQPVLPSPLVATNSPHGVPWGGPGADLSVVVGGGQSCP